MFLTILFIAYYAEFNTKSFLYFVIPLFVILILPTLYIHLNYYNIGKDFIFELDKEKIKVIKEGYETIFYKENFKVIELSDDDIKRFINFFHSPSGYLLNDKFKINSQTVKDVFFEKVYLEV